MKCNYCGFESESNFIFCPSCGKEAPVDVYGDRNPAASHILSVLKDKLFFTLCILLTVASGCSLLAGSLNLLAILATIFIWLVYNASIKNIADAKNLRCLSGTYYAYYVILNVAAIIMGACALITLLLSGVTLSFSLLSGEWLNEFENGLADIWGPVVASLAFVSPLLISIVLLIATVLIFIFNIWGIRSIHKFLKSVYQSVESGVICYEKRKTAETWLMVFGVLSAISSLSELGTSVLAFCSTAALAAVQIIASLLIKKHFSELE